MGKRSEGDWQSEWKVGGGGRGMGKGGEGPGKVTERKGGWEGRGQEQCLEGGEGGRKREWSREKPAEGEGGENM